MDPRTEHVARMLQADLATPLSIQRLAADVNLSSSRLAHLFRRDLGCSLKQYVRRLRMERARELAETTFLSVKEIMVHVGIRDASHFVRDFERTFGLTPARHRLRHHSAEGGAVIGGLSRPAGAANE